MPTEREWLLRIRRPWRVGEVGSFFYIFDDEEHQIARLSSEALARHIVALHNEALGST